MKKLDPRSVIIGFLVAVIGFMSIGATNTTFDSITVGEIILKDQSLLIKTSLGNDIMILSTFPGADGIMGIYNSKGIITTTIGNSPHGGGMLEVNDSDGDRSITLGQTKNKTGAIQLDNKHNKNIVWIGATNEDDGHIILSDRYGEGQWGRTGKRP